MSTRRQYRANDQNLKPLLVRLDPNAHSAIRRESEAQGVSMSVIVNQLIFDRFGTYPDRPEINEFILSNSVVPSESNPLDEVIDQLGG